MTTPESAHNPNGESAHLSDTIARRYNWEQILYPVIFNNTPGATENIARVLHAITHGGETATQQRSLREFNPGDKEALAAPPPETYAIDPDIKKKTEDWAAGTLRCASFMNNQRKALIEEHIGRNIDLQWLLTCGGVDTGTAHPAIAHAFTAIGNKFMEVGDALDDAWIDYDRGESANTLFVGNYKDLGLLRLGLDRPQIAAWAQQQIDDFPRWLTDGIPGLSFSPETPTRPQPNGSTRIVLGDYAISGTTQRMLRSINIYSYHLNKSHRARHGLLNLEIAGEIATHEIGHFAHFNRVPLSWLRDYWLPAITTEPVAVTEYVANLNNPKDILREDFCDSLTLYRHEPAELIYKSTARMQALNTLLRRYPDDLLTNWAPHIKTIHNEIQRISYKQLFVAHGKKWHARLVASQQP